MTAAPRATSRVHCFCISTLCSPDSTAEREAALSSRFGFLTPASHGQLLTASLSDCFLPSALPSHSAHPSTHPSAPSASSSILNYHATTSHLASVMSTTPASGSGAGSAAPLTLSDSPARTLITDCLRRLDESSLRTLHQSRTLRAQSTALCCAIERLQAAASNEVAATSHRTLTSQTERRSRLHSQLLDSAAVIAARGGAPPSSTLQAEVPQLASDEAFSSFCQLCAALEQSAEQHRQLGEVFRVSPGLAVPVRAVLRSTPYVELTRRVEEMRQLVTLECTLAIERKTQLDSALAQLLANKERLDCQPHINSEWVPQR